MPGQHGRAKLQKSTWKKMSARRKVKKKLTNYNAGTRANLRDQFYEHLSLKIKDKLVHFTCATFTLNELITVTTDIDTQVCQRHAEKEREKKRTNVLPEMTVTLTPFLNSLPKAEPVAMYIDATQT